MEKKMLALSGSTGMLFAKEKESFFSLFQAFFLPVCMKGAATIW
jgi:hypothetical protein